MENGGKVSALSDHGSKAIWDPEDQRGGAGGEDDGGNGSGRGDGGDHFSGSSKGDDTSPNSLFSWYLLLLNKYPVRTKAITSALMTLFGDLVCQVLASNVLALAWNTYLSFATVAWIFLLHVQVLASNVLALAWNTYLSFATHKDVMIPAQKETVSR